MAKKGKKPSRVPKKEAAAMGERIRQVRLEKDLTQEEFGKYFKRTRAAIASIEGGYNVPTIANLKVLKKKFKASYDYIIDGVEEKPQPGKIEKQLQENTRLLHNLLEIMKNWE